MMLANDELRTVLVTIHMSLRSAIDAITLRRACSRRSASPHARRARAAGRRGRASPSPGLNPHAGEGGLFGDEEMRVIAPAIAAARAEGIDASGPFAPDTVFMRARHAPGHPGEFDLVVAMTHDHGLIPVKYLGVEHGVNVTLGLPFVRTSPDHGTAFDIAGQRPRRPVEPRGRGAHGARARGCRRLRRRRLSAASARSARRAACAPAASRAPSGRRSRPARMRPVSHMRASMREVIEIVSWCLPPRVKTKKLRPELTCASRTFCHSSFRCIW